MAEGIRPRLTAAQGRKFGWTLGIAFGVIAGISFWRGHETVPLVLGSIAGLFLVAGTVAPTLLDPVERGWMAMALGISKVTTPVFMGIVYYGVVTPTGVLVRLFKGNPLHRVERNGGFWVERESGRPDPATMKHQF